MKKNYTHITLVLDRSGSMEKVKDDTIGGFNNFIADQKKVEGLASFSLIQFDDKYEPNYLFKNIQEVSPLDGTTFKPRGWTCLLDAVGRAIVETGENLNKIPEENKPEKVVFVIQTDGEENKSKEFSYEDVSNLIKKQTDNYKWEFVFLGAKLEAVKQAQKWGINPLNTMAYADNAIGTKNVFKSISNNLCSYRSGGAQSMAFNDQDRKAQEQAGLDNPAKTPYGNPYLKKSPSVIGPHTKSKNKKT